MQLYLRGHITFNRMILDIHVNVRCKILLLSVTYSVAEASFACFEKKN